MNEDAPQYEEIKPGEMLLSMSGGDYSDLPSGEPLEGNVVKVEKVMGTNFTTKEPEEKVSVSVKEAETGQVYSNWMSKSLHPKSSLGKLTQAMFGDEVPRNSDGLFDVYEMVGKPLRFFLTEPEDKKGTGVKRQYMDTQKGFLKPAKDQKVLDTTEVSDPIPGSEIDQVFSKA